MTLIPVIVAFCLFSAFITFGLGIYVFAKNPGSTSHRLFLLVMLTATYWAFGEYSLWQGGSYEEFLFWLKISSFWPLATAFMLHFILYFTNSAVLNKMWSRVVLFLIYAPAILFALTEIGTSLIYTVRFLPGTGFIYQPVEGDPVYLAETAYILIIMASAVLASILAWKRAAQQKIRRQYRLVSAGLIMVIGFGTLSGIILPLSGIYLPNLVFVGIVLFSLIITYSILRHELFTLDPGSAAPDIIRTLPDGLLLGDMEGRIIMTNASAAAMFSANEEDLPGRKIRELLENPACSSIRSGLLEKGYISDVEATFGEENPKVVIITGSLVRDPGGDPAGFVLILHDITRRKESERALRLANEKISLMTRLTRHDIANLVSGLWGYLEFLKEDRFSPDAGLYIDNCLDLTRKISRHLQFTREFQDIGIYKPDWQSLEVMFAKAVTDLPHTDITINRSIMPVEVYVDPLAYKVLYNVLENAIRHGETATRIDILTSETENGELLILIEDDGEGIPERDKTRIFGHGFGKHTGIGLALSREILDVTGITISETGVFGEGARFEIAIPRRAWRKLEDRG
jgi:PAS domain S-box-containing protein